MQHGRVRNRGVVCMTVTDPDVSVLVATRNRVHRLARLLDDLEAARAATRARVEILIADNGSTDGTATLLEQWSAALPDRVHLFVEQPGKTHALNCLLGLARAPLLVFTDDDVEVPPDWLRAVTAFIADYPHYDAAMGRVVVPSEVTDPGVLALVGCYPGVVPLFDKGDLVCEVDDMYGCNMVVRRRALERVGRFNERLGPGAAGLHDDVDLARRIRAAGMRIGYMPHVVVRHDVDSARLTDQYYWDFQLRVARSTVEMGPPPPIWRHLRRMGESALSFVWWSLRGVTGRRTRAWGRVLRHGMIALSSWRGGQRRVPAGRGEAERDAT